MVRLFLSTLLCCAVAVGSLGCSGQNIEGAWLGPMPFEGAKACRIRIYSDHRFEVACGNFEWAGAGKVERDGANLTLQFTALVRRGQPQRDKPVLHFTFKGEGNTIRLQDVPHTRDFVWERARL